MSEVVSTGFGKAIAERMERGERAAESEFVELYRRRVTALVMGRLHDTVAAEDLTQEILMAVLIAVRNGRLSDPEKLPSFVRGVARNICNKHLRDRLHRLDRMKQTPLRASRSRGGRPLGGRGADASSLVGSRFGLCWRVDLVELRLIVENREIRITTGPIAIFEAGFPGPAQIVEGFPFVAELALNAGTVV